MADPGTVSRGTVSRSADAFRSGPEQPALCSNERSVHHDLNGVICTYTGLRPELIEGFLSEVVVKLAGAPVASDHAVLQDAEGRILERAMIKARGSFVGRPSKGVLARQLLTLVVAQPLRRDGAVGKPLSERLVVTMPGRDPQRIVAMYSHRGSL